MPNIQMYNFSLPNGEIKSSGPYRNAHIAAFHLLQSLPEDVQFVRDVHVNRYERCLDANNYVMKNGHALLIGE